MRTIIAIVALLSVFTAEARAAGKIPKQLPEPHRSIAGLTLGVSTRERALGALGAAMPWPRPDKHHDPFRYCYQLKAEQPAWLILGFGWSYAFEKLDSVSVTTDKEDLDGPCTDLAIAASTLATTGGLHLGLAKPELKRIIGDDPTADGLSFKYEYEIYEKYPEPIKHSGSTFLYVGEYHYGSIDLSFTNNKVSKFSLWIGGEPDW